MFKIIERNEVNRSFLKCDSFRYSPAEIFRINTPNSQSYFSLPREDSVISLFFSYLDLNFEIIKRSDNCIYANGDDIRLVSLRPIALFSNFKLTTSSGKHLEDISKAHIVCSVYKLITSSTGSDDFSIGFDRDRNRRRSEITNNKNIKRNYHHRFMLKDIFSFAEHQIKRLMLSATN